MAKPPDIPASERRRFPRVAVEQTNIKLAATTGQIKVAIERIIDFSFGGLQVELADKEPEPKIGSLMDVNLEWPGGAGRFDASVRRTIPGDAGRHRIGIEFDDADLVRKSLGSWFRKTAKP